MSEVSTCKICEAEYQTDITMPDIDGNTYCYVCWNVCLNCGIQNHQCEEVDE